MDDAFADLTGFSSAPKPMRAQPAPAKPAGRSPTAILQAHASSGSATVHSTSAVGAHHFSGLDDLTANNQQAQSATPGATQQADTADGFALFDDLALPQDVSRPGPDSASAEVSPTSRAKPTSDSTRAEAPRASKGSESPCSASEHTSAKATTRQRLPADRVKSAAPGRHREPQPSQRSEAPPAYDDVVGAPAQPNGADSDSSVDVPAVPSVFIRIRDVLRQGQDALTQGVASVSAAAGDLAARMPRPDSQANAAASTTTTATSPSSTASPVRAAPLHQGAADLAASADAAVSSNSRGALQPSTPAQSEAPRKVKAKARASGAEPQRSSEPQTDFLGLSDETSTGTAPNFAPPANAATLRSPDVDLLDSSENAQPERNPNQDVEATFAAVDDLDDFFSGGAAAPTSSATPAVTFGSAATSPAVDLIGGMSAGPADGGSEEGGDVVLERAIAEAHDACSTLPPERAAKVQQAIASAHEYVEARVTAKRQVEGVTEAGLHYAKLNAARTAGQVLTKSFEHHVREARHEVDVAEASEYKDEIKASIKQWAFQGGQRRGLRNLLMDLDKVLWEGAPWGCKNLADVSTDSQVKKWLNKARLLLHTDKMSGQPEKVRLRAELILIEIDKALKGTV